MGQTSEIVWFIVAMVSIMFNVYLIAAYVPVTMGEFHHDTQKICIYPDRHGTYTQSVNETLNHEMCHAMVYHDYNGFCEGGHIRE